MFILVVSFFSFFLLLSKSLLLKPLPRWASEVRLLSVLFFQELLCSLAHLFGGRAIRAQSASSSPRKMCSRKAHATEEPAPEMSVLDLPELVLESILERLSPAGLCNMAAVCSSMRERCTSDYLWEKHMREKWGKVVGLAADRQWKLYAAAKREAAAAAALSDISPGLNWTGVLSSLLPISLFKSAAVDDAKIRSSYSPAEDESIMAWYKAIESGQIWFPAQVYNREQGHVGFMLSCYDAEVCYDCRSNTFRARYPPHGRRPAVVEEGVEWDRLRAIPVDTPAHSLHVSDCLSDLRPGDHIEIQWRRNKEFPYGWWYGVIGHLDSCDGNERFCRCHLSGTVTLEFNQYSLGSRWRLASINRREHQEEGNESDGFYGGVRKLGSKDEISQWRQHWPTDILG